MTTRLLINIDVDDLQKATDFYCKAFDLHVARRFGSDAVELLGATSPIYLLVKPNGTVASATSRHLRSYARHWTPIHLDFVVDEMEGAIDRARNAGARLEGPVRTNNWGRIAMLADPFGHGVCLIEFIGKGYDEIATAESQEKRGATAKNAKIAK
jgi:predicted enzyme related to lactoylglutathione lyase